MHSYFIEIWIFIEKYFNDNRLETVMEQKIVFGKLVTIKYTFNSLPKVKQRQAIYSLERKQNGIEHFEQTKLLFVRMEYTSLFSILFFF